MTMRFIRLVFILLVIIGIHGVTLAQDANCGDLSEADCTLLTESSAVMGEIESGILHLDVNITVDSGVGGNVVSAQIRGDGGFTIDRDAYNDLINGPISDAAVVANLVRVLVGSTLDMSFLFSLPGEIGGLTGVSTVDEVGTLDFRIVDGVFYVNTDKLTPSLGQAPLGWFGIDYADGIAEILLRDASALSTSVLLLRTMPPPDFSAWARVDDIEIDGQTMAVFEQVIAFADLIADPLIRQSAATQLLLFIQTEGLDAGFSQAQLETAVNNYIELFAGLTLTMQQVIGTDDYYVYDAVLIIDWQPSTDAQLDVLSGPDPLGFGAFAGNMHTEVRLNIRHHNQTPPVTAPDAPTVIPLQEILGF